MKVTLTEKKDVSQAEIDITVEPKEFQLYVERAAKQLTNNAPLKGFRPGKAPIKVVAETFGQDKLLHEAMDLALPRFFVQAALDNDVQAINRPSITVHELGLDSPFRFTAVVDVLPEVTLGEVSAISAEKRPVEVSDEQMTKELAYLTRSRSQYIDVARGAQTGDVVTVDFVVRMNGVEMEGGSSKNHPITIGEGHFVPDFEKGLLGLAVNEERTYDISFPEDFQNKDLKGKKAEVWVKAHSVQQRVIPELNDDFARSLGKFTDLQQLKDELKKNIKVELDQKEEDRFLGTLAEKLAEGAIFGHIPQILIDKEIESRLAELAQMLSVQQKTMDQYLAQQSKTLEQVKEEMRVEAEKHVKVGLAMRTFADTHNVTVEDEEIETKANEHLRVYEHIPQAQANLDVDDLKERVASTLRNQKTLQKLAEMIEKK